jgi:hypothetical protein
MKNATTGEANSMIYVIHPGQQMAVPCQLGYPLLRVIPYPGSNPTTYCVEFISAPGVPSYGLSMSANYTDVPSACAYLAALVKQMDPQAVQATQPA